MIAALICVPGFAGLVALALRRDGLRRALLVAAAAVHTGLVVAAWTDRPAPLWRGRLALDPLGLLFLTVTSALFLIASVYAAGYLARENRAARPDFEEGSLFANGPEAVFTACLLFFLATMTLVTSSQHLGLLWVAVEATTLSSAPLIAFHRHHRSLEATWKYLLICSVGIALALLGNFFLTVAGSGAGGAVGSMALTDLLRRGPSLQGMWLKAAFILLLVGYGTKMGLAPLHTWLPDAHAEAPSVASALLSGALLNCAFLAILRVLQVVVAAGEGAFGQELLLFFGLFSMAFSAIFIVGQPDFKRMLAYSSVEHMGILALGVGIGGAATFGAMYHAVNHSLTKGMLFLVAGNLLAAYKTKVADRVSGALRVTPWSGLLWLVGLFAITGSPPFGPFLSELTILTGALDAGRTWVAAAYLLLLAVVFVGMGRIMLGMAQGAAVAGVEEHESEVWLAVVPPAVLAGVVLLLGLYLPPGIGDALHGASQMLGGK